jgi:hypothetical protein
MARKKMEAAKPDVAGCHACSNKEAESYMGNRSGKSRAVCFRQQERKPISEITNQFASGPQLHSLINE